MTFPPLAKAKATAAQLGLELDREVDHDHLEAAVPMDPLTFHAALMAYCYRFRASVTSYGRTNQHNAAEGGGWDSRHQVWLASDVVYD